MALPDLLKHIGIDARLVGENYMTNCPYAAETHESGQDSRPSFGVHADNFIFHCFTCHKAGHLEQLVEFMLKVRIQDALEVVYEYIDNYTVFHEAEYHLFGVVPKPPIRIFDEYFNTPFLGGIPRYVVKRGISVETAMEYGLGHDQRNHRLTFPVRNHHGKLVGLIGRTYRDNAYGPKYFNYVEFDKSRVLFGENIAYRHRSQTEPVYVVEGPMDVLKMAQAGFRNTVAIMGSHASKEQIKRILSISPIVCAFLDADRAGTEGTKKMLLYLPHKKLLVLKHKDGKKDAGEYTDAELRSHVHSNNLQVLEHEYKKTSGWARQHSKAS